VAEHRAGQRAALLAATEQILLDTGLAGVMPRSVAERAGLARSTFYEYFGSRDDILAAVAIEAFERWGQEVDRALAGVAQADRLSAYVEATIRMAADGKHGIASLLRQAELSPSRYDDVMALHDTLLQPITEILRGADVTNVRMNAALVQALLGAGVQSVTHGAEVTSVTEGIVALLTSGLPRDPVV
jgi:AcrR family transcriptional regulator